MIYFDAGKGMRTALWLCVLGAGAVIAALLFNNAWTLLIYLFIGLPMLIAGMILVWTADWKEILKKHVSGDRRKETRVE